MKHTVTVRIKDNVPQNIVDCQVLHIFCTLFLEEMFKSSLPEIEGLQVKEGCTNNTDNTFHFTKTVNVDYRNLLTA